VSALKRHRIQSNLTIEEVSKKIGISHGYLWEIENGRKTIGPDRAEDFSRLYGLPIHELFTPVRFAVRE